MDMQSQRLTKKKKKQKFWCGWQIQPGKTEKNVLAHVPFVV
jgi:hypothetical protein